MVALALFAVLALALFVGAVVLARTIRGLLEQRFGALEERLGEVDVRVHNRLEGLDTRLLSTQQSSGQQVTQIVEKLTRLDGTAAQPRQPGRRTIDLASLGTLSPTRGFRGMMMPGARGPVR